MHGRSLLWQDNRRMTRLLRLLMQPATSIGPRLRHYISSKGNASTMLTAILEVDLSRNDVMILGEVYSTNVQLAIRLRSYKKLQKLSDSTEADSSKTLN
jgi:hypothetical protein